MKCGKLFFNALRQLQQLKIKYQIPGRSMTVRELAPYHAVRYDGDWYVIGHCHLRNKIRTFSLSRIRHASMLADNFVLPNNFNFHHVTSSRFGVHWGEAEEQVKIWFTPDAAPYVLERKWHPSQEILHNEDGSIILALTVNHLPGTEKVGAVLGKGCSSVVPGKAYTGYPVGYREYDWGLCTLRIATGSWHVRFYYF
jgi:hypothetical protein